MTQLFGDLQQAADQTELAIALEAWETPPKAVDDLLAYRPEFGVGADLWEPCAGTGVLVDALRRRGAGVTASDVHDWGYRLGTGEAGYAFLGDVLQVAEPLAHTVVTNPPFKRAAEIVEHLLAIGVQTVVLLQAWNWFLAPSSTPAGRMFDRRLPCEILALMRRITLWRFDVPLHARKSSSPIRYAWYVWRAGVNAPPAVVRLPKAPAAGSERAEGAS